MKMVTRARGAFAPTHEVSCFTCQNRDKTEWCVLAEEDVRLLDDAKRIQTYPTGQTLFHQGENWEGLYCVESGTVALRLTDAQGNSILVRLAHAGETVGYRGFFGNGVYATSAEVIQPTTVCRVSGDSLRAALSHNPTLGLRFLTHLVKDLDQAEEALLHQSTLPVRVRVVHLLLSLKDRFGEVGDDGVLEIALPMARQDMAALLGARPETIARALHDLKADGVVQLEGRHALVPDLDLLLDEIEPFPA